MVTSENRDDHTNIGYAATDTVYGHLPIVDIWKDRNIWAIPDGGCNSSCHSRAWRENAQNKLAKMGRGYTGLYTEDPNTKSFSGLGAAKSTCVGRFKFPTAYKTWNPHTERWQVAVGELVTNEI